MRSWNAGGAHECLLEVRLDCGPIGQLVPMGRAVWAAGQDGSVQTLEGQTLQPSGTRRKAHAGYVSGLCTLGARTTRQCWSYSLSDETVSQSLPDRVHGFFCRFVPLCSFLRHHYIIHLRFLRMPRFVSYAR